MNEVFNYWQHSPNRVEGPMPKIRRKVPMELKVITEQNECWGYVIEHGKPRYYFLYTFWAEKASERTNVPINKPTTAVLKSIKRHKNRNA